MTHTIYAEVRPLKGKRYGTYINIDIPSLNVKTDVKLWLPEGPPSDEELESNGYTREQWNNNEEVDDGWGWTVPIQSSDLICDSHYQSRLEAALCHAIAAAVNGASFDDSEL